MTERECKVVLGMLFAAFPRVEIGPATVRVYVHSMLDFTPEEAANAVNAIVATSPYFPSVSELRCRVVESRLGLPTVEEAWEQAWRMTRAMYGSESKPRTNCLACGGGGTFPAGSDRLCHDCRGSGYARRPIPRVERSVERALDYVGGPWALWTADRQEVVRAQFSKAYERFRRARVDEANLASLGVLPAAAERAALEAST